MTKAEKEGASSTTIKVIIGLVTVLAVLAAPVLSSLVQPNTAPSAAVQSPSSMLAIRAQSRHLETLVKEFSEALGRNNMPRDQIRGLAAAISAHGESGRDALLRLLESWNHPVLFETAGGYGSQARGALRHLDALLEYLETDCARPEPSPRTSMWEQRHVKCSDRAMLRPQVLTAYIDIKFAPENQTTKNWSKPIEELNSAFITAVERDRLETAKRFLGMGANPNWIAPITDLNSPADSPPIDCMTPLISAVQAKSRTMIDLLLSVGADPSDRACSPVPLAVETKEYEILDILLHHGARPNTPNFRGTYPLTIAVRNNDERAVKILLAAGASPHLRGTDGLSPYDIAVERNLGPLLPLLE